MITGIIMASGFSKRLKFDKLLFNVGGKPIIEYVLSSCTNSMLDEILIVFRDKKIGAIAEKYNVKPIKNLYASEGMASSLRLGVSNANLGTDAYMIIMGDQPLFNNLDMNKMIKFSKDNTGIIAASYNGIRKTPVIFPNKYYYDLLKITGDEGGRSIVNSTKDKKTLIEYPIEKSFDLDNIKDIENIKKYIEGENNV